MDIEISNNGLLDLNVVCSIYIKSYDNKDKESIILNINNKGIYYYDEYFNENCCDSLYNDIEKNKIIYDSKYCKDIEIYEKNKDRKKLCPFYIYPRKFNLSYKSRKKIFIIFKPLERHINYQNYYFILSVKNINKGCDLNIMDLFNIASKTRQHDEICGIPLVCINEKNIIKRKRKEIDKKEKEILKKKFGKKISKYYKSSTSTSSKASCISLCDDNITSSSYSQYSESYLKNKQTKKTKYFNKKERKKNFVSLLIPLYANIIEPNINIKAKKLSKSIFINPLYLYKCSFTMKNKNNFYINYFFPLVLNYSDNSSRDKKYLMEHINKEEENKEKNKEKYDSIYYYDYFEIIKDIYVKKSKNKKDEKKMSTYKIQVS